MDPVFIVGVPRSGTTLLRVILDSHPNLSVGPECPWISGNYGGIFSFRHLYESLISHEFGPVKNLMGIDSTTVSKILQNAIDEILTVYAKKNCKERWLEKTPDNIAFIPFLNTIFPNASYLHIIRDGRDVACSSFNCKQKWGNRINFNGQTIENTILNCLKRWNSWLSQFEKWKNEFSLTVYEFRYEDLIADPPQNIKKILSFINEPWNDNVLRYLDFNHDLPEHEMGTQDVKSKGMFSKNSIGRWEKQFGIKEKLLYKRIAGEYLNKFNYL